MAENTESTVASLEQQAADANRKATEARQAADTEKQRQVEQRQARGLEWRQAQLDQLDPTALRQEVRDAWTDFRHVVTNSDIGKAWTRYIAAMLTENDMLGEARHHVNQGATWHGRPHALEHDGMRNHRGSDPGWLNGQLPKVAEQLIIDAAHARRDEASEARAEDMENHVNAEGQLAKPAPLTPQEQLAERQRKAAERAREAEAERQEFERQEQQRLEHEAGLDKQRQREVVKQYLDGLG